MSEVEPIMMPNTSFTNLAIRSFLHWPPSRANSIRAPWGSEIEAAVRRSSVRCRWQHQHDG
jgi:hypothetical protein